MPPRKRMRGKQPPPPCDDDEESLAAPARSSTSDAHPTIVATTPLQANDVTPLAVSDVTPLAAGALCFRDFTNQCNELITLLDEPDDDIRFKMPFLPKKDTPIWQFVRKFKRVPKQTQRDSKDNMYSGFIAA